MIKDKKVTALLPMKGNSERVPNKNLKLFNGVPLYRKILDALLASSFIDEVVVNTDSDNIKTSIQNTYSNNVVINDRPSSICGDFVSMNKIIEYDINKISSNIYIQTHSTNPLLKTKTVDSAIKKYLELYESKKFDSLFSVTKIQTRLYSQEGLPYNHNPLELLRTQDLQPLFEENSNFYIFSKDSFNKARGKRIGLSPYLFQINKIEAVDIDDPEDFIIAETLSKVFK